jgi:transcriptional regulator with XRE-family HTH domain
LYEKFAELLVKYNKTAYRVSKETGIAQSVLSDWKNGRSKPKADKLKKIADYFGVTVDYFLEK